MNLLFRFQIELENLNTATDEINKLEIELEEANSTFRILLNESTRRLKLSSKKLGNCIDKARPYYEATEKAREARIECQKAAKKFQRSNEIHAAAKETVALAEQRFMSNSHEWQFDNAWQEMLNHATQMVMDAEKQKAECDAEHQRLTKIFHAAEQKMQQLEVRFRRSIVRSRPYFEEKQICQDQLQTQKNRITELQQQIQNAKSTYSTALRNLERISDDIHRQRGDYPLPLSGVPPPGPREPGVGAELNSPTTTALPDFEAELQKCDYPSIVSSQASLGGASHTTASAQLDDEYDDDEQELYGKTNEHSEEEHDMLSATLGVTPIVDEKDLEALRQKVKQLAVRPIEGGDGQQQQNANWEHELTATVNKLDHLMMLNERAIKQKQLQQKQQQQKAKMQQQQRPDLLGAEAKQPMIEKPQPLAKQLPIGNIDDDDDVVLGKTVLNSLPVTPAHGAKFLSPATPIKQLKKLEPLPSVNVSMRELPLLARISNEIRERASSLSNRQRRRSLH